MSYEQKAKCCHCGASFADSSAQKKWRHYFRNDDFDPDSAECSDCIQVLTINQRAFRLRELGWKQLWGFF